MNERQNWNENQSENIGKTLVQKQYKKYLEENVRINQEKDESLFEWADFFSVKDLPNWNTAILDWKEINSYINIQLQQKNKDWKLITKWKEYPVLIFKNNVYNLDIKTWNIQLSSEFQIDNWKINLINKKEANKSDNTKSEEKEYSNFEKSLWLDKEHENNTNDWEDSSYWEEHYKEEELENLYNGEIKWWIPENQLIEWDWEWDQIEFDENEETIFEIPQIRPENWSLYENMEYDIQNELNNLILDSNIKNNIFEKFQEIYDWDFETNTEEKTKWFYKYLRNEWLDVLVASLLLWETTKEYFKNKIK